MARDLASASRWTGIGQVLKETQTYRIDHYLGKETVQNILAFRFGNGVFEPIWNRRYIDHVQITASETVGVEQRGGYYDRSGALRDMVPNHLFQLISLTAMEPPASFDANAVRDEQTKVLRAINPFTPQEVLHDSVRGQYGPGVVTGQPRVAYRNEPSVAPDSTTETFVALKLHVDNWRWADVPFYLRTGKSLPKRETTITIQFKRPPFLLFRDTPVEQFFEPIASCCTCSPTRDRAKLQRENPGRSCGWATSTCRSTTLTTSARRRAPATSGCAYDCMTDERRFSARRHGRSRWSVVQPILDV